jgi:hypothetical protein
MIGLCGFSFFLVIPCISQARPYAGLPLRTARLAISAPLVVGGLA